MTLYIVLEVWLGVVTGGNLYLSPRQACRELADAKGVRDGDGYIYEVTLDAKRGEPSIKAGSCKHVAVHFEPYNGEERP